MAARSKKTIIACGYHIDFSNLQEELERLCPDTDFGDYTVLTGVFYGQQCRGGLFDAQKSQEELKLWFGKKKLRLRELELDHNVSYLSGYIREIYVSKNGNYVAGLISVESQSVYCFFKKKDGGGTTVVKKEICAGSDNFDYHEIERQEVKCRPYLHTTDRDEPIEY